MLSTVSSLHSAVLVSALWTRSANFRFLPVTDIAIRRLIKMAKRITGFKDLIQEDQIVLLKGACFEMMILRAVTHYNIEKDCWQGPHATMIKVDVLKEAKGFSIFFLRF
jgi:hypothetical protein